MTVLAVLAEIEIDQSQHTSNLGQYDMRKYEIAGGFDPLWSRRSASQYGLPGGTRELPFIDTHDGTSNIWIHSKHANAGDYYTMYFGVYNSAGDKLLGIHGNKSNGVGKVGVDGCGKSGWLTNQPAIVVDDYDVCLNLQTKTLEGYRNGALIASFDVSDTLPVDTVAVTCKFTGDSSTNTPNRKYAWSQLIVADEQTIGWHLKSASPSLAGAHQEFVGTANDLNSIFLDETTLNSTDVPAIQTYIYEGVEDPTNDPELTVGGVFLSSVCQSVGGAPAMFYNVVRIGGVDYHAGSTDVSGSDYANYGKPVTSAFPTNPATGLSWTEEDLLTAEFGFKCDDGI